MAKFFAYQNTYQHNNDNKKLKLKLYSTDYCQKRWSIQDENFPCVTLTYIDLYEQVAIYQLQLLQLMRNETYNSFYKRQILVWDLKLQLILCNSINTISKGQLDGIYRTHAPERKFQSITQQHFFSFVNHAIRRSVEEKWQELSLYNLQKYLKRQRKSIQDFLDCETISKREFFFKQQQIQLPYIQRLEEELCIAGFCEFNSHISASVLNLAEDELQLKAFRIIGIPVNKFNISILHFRMFCMDIYTVTNIIIKHYDLIAKDHDQCLQTLKTVQDYKIYYYFLIQNNVQQMKLILY
ncbi:unnamed protein product [Paramecium octaurelia]|uniref:Uncharacterized protein n=1 Tax=Paramecium octaurelia TaxID=43137 RepID=A0A8S1Y9W8_PAROT|nr:unnamed protein product [Paramecium octaurelia]